MATRTCQIESTLLATGAFRLNEGDHIYFKVKASNVYGDSEYSAVGNGASMWTYPDTPLNLANNAQITSASQIGLTWQEGVSNGGTAVLDFRVYYTLDSDNSFTELASSIILEHYTTVVSLVAGANYKFKVQARNAFGYSLWSDELIIRAAEIPLSPVSVYTIVDGDNVNINWTPDYDGGSPVFAFTVLIRQSDTDTYSEQTVNCDGSVSAIVTAAQCSVPIDSLKQEPYSLDWGASVYAKVSATNLVGASPYSMEGNGAIILTISDAP